MRPASRRDFDHCVLSEVPGVRQKNARPLAQSIAKRTTELPACGSRKGRRDRLNDRLAQIRRRLEQAYLDKLDGKITEAFWETKSTEWNQEQESILMALQALQDQSPQGIVDGLRTLELANKAYFLYLRQPPAEKEKLLRIVLSNCKVDALSVYPNYRKPFDLIFMRAQTKEWLPGLDSN